MNETIIQLFEKIKKNDKLLERQIKKKRQKTHIINMGMKEKISQQTLEALKG